MGVSQSEIPPLVWQIEEDPAQQNGWTRWNCVNDANLVVFSMGALAVHPDGRLHVLVTMGEGYVFHSEQTQVSPAAGAAWSGWAELSAPGPLASQVALAVHADGRMHAVVVGTDGQFQHSEQTSAEVGASWTGWAQLPGGPAGVSHIALAAHRDGRMYLVAIDSTGQLWHAGQYSGVLQGGWSGWANYVSEDSSEPKAALVALAAHLDDRLHIVVTGLDGQLWHNEQTPNTTRNVWTNWSYLSEAGQLANRIALAATADGRMHAVMAGLDNQIWYNEQTAAAFQAPWTGWSKLGEQDTSRPVNALALAARPNGRMFALMLDVNYAIFRNEQVMLNPSTGLLWSTWAFFGEGAQAQGLSQVFELAVAAHPDGRVHALARGFEIV